MQDSTDSLLVLEVVLLYRTNVLTTAYASTYFAVPDRPSPRTQVRPSPSRVFHFRIRRRLLAVQPRRCLNRSRSRGCSRLARPRARVA